MRVVIVGVSFVDVVCHERGVSRLKLSVDGSLLFSAGADGALCIFEVSPDLDARPKGLKDHGMVEGQFAEEILVTKADLDEQVQAPNHYSVGQAENKPVCSAVAAESVNCVWRGRPR